MLVKSIIFTNNNGEKITFAHNLHFRLESGFDLSALSATINQSSNTNNGATYQSTKIDTRDFDIDFFVYRNCKDQSWIEEKRHELFKVFNPSKNPIRIDFITKAEKEYYIVGELTATPSLPQGFENDNRVWQKGLLQFNASDPFIYEKEETKTDVAFWKENIEFPLEVIEEGIEVSYRVPSLIVNVENKGSNDTGMLIRFKALSELVNPSLLNVNTYEKLKLNFTMLAGDIIEISTYKGKRTAVLIRNYENTNVFGKVELTSTFLQLRVGDNLFRYDADDGIDYLECEIIHRNTLIGV